MAIERYMVYAIKKKSVEGYLDGGGSIIDLIVDNANVPNEDIEILDEIDLDAKGLQKGGY